MRSRSMGSMTLAITLVILLLSAALLAASHGLLTQAIRTQGEGFASGRDRMLAESRLDEAMALLLQDPKEATASASWPAQVQWQKSSQSSGGVAYFRWWLQAEVVGEGGTGSRVEQSLLHYPLLLRLPPAPLLLSGSLQQEGKLTLDLAGEAGSTRSFWSKQPQSFMSSMFKVCSANTCQSVPAGVYHASNTGRLQLGDPLFPVSLPDYLFGLPAAVTLPELNGLASASLPDCSSLDSTSHGVVVISGPCELTGEIGSAAAPLLLVISGPLSLATSSQLNGLIYLQAQENELCFASQSRIQGAVVVSGDLKVTGAGGRIVYDKALLQRLQQAIENFRWVRVPGSWRDW